DPPAEQVGIPRGSFASIGTSRPGAGAHRRPGVEARRRLSRPLALCQNRRAPPGCRAPPSSQTGGLIMRGKTSRAPIPVLVALLGGLCLAFGAPPARAATDTLVIAQGADITTLDPTQATQINNLNLFYNLYDALVTWG